MRLLISLLVWTSFLQDFVVGRAVFAHFMVSNTVGYTVANWQNEMRLAQEAHIDAFALNMARAEKTTTDQLGNAFQAASNQGFQLFFSFDYAGNGAWALNDVVALMTQYATNGAYYHRGSQPLASTFEGPGNAADWSTIKSKTGCFFIPDWSSKGAKDALKLGTADGLFNWGAWPEGPNDLYNTVDASYTYYLAQSKLTAYMMPASAWFYTNLPCFDKNWLWRGDSLWYDRWQAIWNEQPEFVQIISWNDFGESHYIGPLPPYESGYEAFSRGQAPFNYVKNMPHDGWRAFLPFLIDVYKSGTASVTREGVQAWYRLQPANACGNGGTTGNTGSQLQTEYNPAVILTDSIFFSALLTSSADVSVTVGGAAIAASWTKKPSSGVGVYHGSVAFGSRTGAVVVKITRGGALVAQMNGASITTACQNGLTNWNAWTGSAMSTASTSGSPPSLSSQVCVSGKGVGNLAGLCSYACERGYCPSTSCTCTQKGSTPIKPTYLVPTVYGCPLPSLDPQYEGLCSFACATGYCPPGACIKSSTKTTCTTTPAKDPPIPAASPMKPRPTTCPLSTEPGSGVICNLGTIPSGVDANFMGLCDFSCNHGFCPKPCVCTRSGTPASATPDKTIGCPAPGYEFIVEYYDLCAYTCSRGYCPTGACVKSTTACKSLSEPSTDKPWYDITCDNPVLTSVTTTTPRERWDVALAQKAWLAAQTWFLELRNGYDIKKSPNTSNPAILITYGYGPNELQFSQIIADYFHATEKRSCQNVPDVNCDVTVNCGQASSPNAAVDSPAGELIMNSFANIHGSIDTLQSSISNAQISSFGDAGTAVKMMTNFVDATKALIALDSIMLALSLVGAQFWGYGLKQLAGKTVAESSYKAVVQDSVTAFIAFGINVGKDLVSLTSELNAISNFQSLASGMCKVMQRANANLSSTLFGGTPAGLTRLEYLVDQGTSYGVKAPNGYDVQLQIEAAIVATLLPTLWSANGEGGQFIMTTQGLDMGSGCDVKNPPKLEKLWLGFTDAMRFNGYSCIDGTGYWLLSASTQSCSTSSGVCKGGIAALKGVERLTGLDAQGNPVFGGLTKEALIQSSLNAYKNNGNKNGWKSADPADHGVILSIIDLGVTAPGIFNAPICGADEALTNVRATRTGGKSANYPCN